MDRVNTGPRLNLTKSEFLTIAGVHKRPFIIPLCVSLPLPEISPVDLYDGICRFRKGSPSPRPAGFLLESMDGDEKTATYSFIGISPVLRVTVDKTIRIAGDQEVLDCFTPPKETEAIDIIKEILGNFRSYLSPVPRFSGGFVGYFPYDLVYSLLPLSGPTHLDSRIEGPLAEFMLSTDCIAFDHRNRTLWIIRNVIISGEKNPEELYNTETAALLQGIEEIEAVCSGAFPPPAEHHSGLKIGRGSSPSSEGSFISRDILSAPPGEQNEFIGSVEKIKEYIRQGEVIQAVLSRCEEHPFEGDPFSLYRALREVNPGPYMYYLDFSDHVVVGASPEMLVRVEGRNVTTVPIAGTRKRGQDKIEDDALERELLADLKEQAEHVMLVDLARNDIGSVCRYGSVRVPQFMEIGKYSHVQHIISTVTGELRDKFDCFDAFRACFPAGTVSGAPKIRAIEIIDTLELQPRGLYAGAVGYIGFDQRLEFAIAIRTAVIRDGIASVQVGAGIVADSVPSREFIETNEKVAAMRAAIRVAGGGL
jgi:anthranilate synthase component I